MRTAHRSLSASRLPKSRYVAALGSGQRTVDQIGPIYYTTVHPPTHFRVRSRPPKATPLIYNPHTSRLDEKQERANLHVRLCGPNESHGKNERVL